jgi:exopolyphosphatase/guanosine-5'-triphosphate,3'-diphosphate pyrophosphatase
VTVGILDVGSSTVRLLVARLEAGRPAAVREERAYLGLGAEVERRGRIPSDRLEEAAAVAGRYARLARSHGVGEADAFVTAPGREAANAAELVRRLAHVTGWPVRILSAEEEGRLAFAGALARAGGAFGLAAVCDVGGGSTEIVVGTRDGGPAWLESLPLGSVRLTEHFLADDPPGKKAVAAVRAEVERGLTGVTPPLPHVALATGGSARALRRLAGRRLGAAELESAIRLLRRRGAEEVAATFGIELYRARTLAAGAVVLAEIQRRLGVPFEVARGGLREGAALALLAGRAEAA